MFSGIDIGLLSYWESCLSLETYAFSQTYLSHEPRPLSQIFFYKFGWLSKISG